ncbi:terminase large subunit [Gordonia phage Yvonnetastic]|uniref:Terminase large subunit n=1 Tax=Gordonia phage Yvonnetastic TaxID=1821566 RepID=A0A142K8Y9_9CAUD|nr:terminase large subunit [Gordonia phage Yvonnetastic]AMS02572.1 terminase large subunit [Gordonia phage Yvonnetastic]
MPHEVFHSPDVVMDRSLGWLAADWIERQCIRGNGPIIGEPVKHLVDDYVRFVVLTYAISEEGRLLHTSSFLSRAKGWAKSELAAFIGLFDALGPSRFDHYAEPGEKYVCPHGTGYVYYYQPGEPVGKHMATPIVQCVATEEGQAGEVYSTIYLNCSEGPLRVAFDGNAVGLTRIMIPGGGFIKPISAKGDSKDGGKATLVLADETHLWKTNELHNLYKTLGRNLLKRRREGTFFLETSTMFGIGEGSVAEQAYEAVKTIREGKFKGRISQLFDHRYGQIDAEDLDDPEKVRAALTESYAEALEWNDLESMVDSAMDLRLGADITSTFRYFFNDAWGAIDSWLASYQWSQCGSEGYDDDYIEPEPIQKGDVITLGFDGSRKRERGITDSTALIACRVRDGLIFPIEIWEQPLGWNKDYGWEAPMAEVQAKVKQAFATFRVVAFYADPAYWVDTVSGWEAKYGSSLKVKASQKHPCEYWMTGGVAKRTVATIDKAEEAILNRELKHFDDPRLTTHVLNCRRKETTAGRQLGKETPNSPKKIDAAIAMILAWQARLDAVAAGVAIQKKRVAYRLR